MKKAEVSAAEMREIVKKEINENVKLDRYARPRMSAPREYSRADRSVFKKNSADKLITGTIKANHKLELKKVFGKDWKKHLNTPNKQIGTVKMTF